MNLKAKETFEDNTAPFLTLVRHPFKFRIYLLTKLPAAFFSGLRVVSANSTACTVSVPYTAFTKNPFRSTYFACLSMAAELSTGVLAMAHLYRRHPSVSMLITGMESIFHKKATGLTYFTCSQGEAIGQAIAKTIIDGQAQPLRVHSVGRNKKGEVVAECWFTWSFRRR